MLLKFRLTINHIFQRKFALDTEFYKHQPCYVKTTYLETVEKRSEFENKLQRASRQNIIKIYCAKGNTFLPFKSLLHGKL